MANVGIPYLESGESLVLTTDRVSVNNVQYDVLLTTRYLILVDVRYAQFQPQMIPLLTVQYVKGGSTANGELVITLFFTDTGGSDTSEPMILVFSQQPSEHRKRERDDWLKTLMGLIVSVRQETSYERITTADPEIGIRPSMRRPIAPDIPHPFTKDVETHPAQIELIIIPDEPESPLFSEMSFPEEEIKSEFTSAPCAMEETAVDSADVSGPLDTTLLPIPAIEEKPADSQEAAESPNTELLPVPVIEEKPVDSQEAAESPDRVTRVPGDEGISGIPAMDSGAQTTVSISLLAAVKSLSSPIGRTSGLDTQLPPLHRIERMPDALPEVTGSPDTLLIPEAPAIVSYAYPVEEKAEQILPPETTPIHEKLIPSQEPETIEPPAVPVQDFTFPEPVFPEAGNGDMLVQQPSFRTPPNPPVPPSPSGSPHSRRLAFIAVAAIILIILGIAGVMVYSSQNQTTPGVEITPLPTSMIQPTPQPPPQPSPQPTPVMIPPNGVWVRVDYPRNYYGWVGNPGSLKAVNGVGDQIFRIPVIDGIVQAQFYKPDNSGDTLTVEVYRDGKIIRNRSVSIPKGSIELLIDAKTGNPPGITPVATPSGNQTGANSSRIMYF